MAFTNRSRPGSVSSRRRKAEAITLGDRLVCMGFGAGAGLVFWTITYSVMFICTVMLQSKPAVAARIAAGQASATPWEVMPEFWYWGEVCAAALALYAVLAGPERMMDGFAKLFDWQSDRADDLVCQVEFSNND